MLSKPKHGWTTIEVFGNRIGAASYLGYQAGILGNSIAEMIALNI